MSATGAIVPFPSLPAELLREILEFAACSHIPTALSLTRVSSSSRLWALPILYGTVMLRSARDVKSFLYTLSLSQESALSKLTPNVPLSRQVKNLGILALGPLRCIEGIISRCTGIQSLACGFSLTSYAAVSLKLSSATAIEKSINTHVREQHLLGLACRDGLPFSLLNPDTTRLHVQPSTEQTLLSLTEIHQHLPALTHLALSVSSNLLPARPAASALLHTILEQNEHLEVILVQVTDLSEVAFRTWETVYSLLDTRVVVTRAKGSVVTQWQDASATGHGRLWQSAEKEVQLRGFSLMESTV